MDWSMLILLLKARNLWLGTTSLVTRVLIVRAHPLGPDHQGFIDSVTIWLNSYRELSSSPELWADGLDTRASPCQLIPGNHTFSQSSTLAALDQWPLHIPCRREGLYLMLDLDQYVKWRLGTLMQMFEPRKIQHLQLKSYSLLGFTWNP